MGAASPASGMGTGFGASFTGRKSEGGSDYDVVRFSLTLIADQRANSCANGRRNQSGRR